MPDKLFMPAHPSSPFSHAYTHTSSTWLLPSWVNTMGLLYKGLSIWVQSRLDPCPNDTYIHTYTCDCLFHLSPKYASTKTILNHNFTKPDSQLMRYRKEQRKNTAHTDTNYITECFPWLNYSCSSSDPCRASPISKQPSSVSSQSTAHPGPGRLEVAHHLAVVADYTKHTKQGYTTA